MHSVAANPLDADRNDDTADRDTPMVDAESDDEIFEDVMPQRTEANEIPTDVHDVAINIDMNSPQAQSLNYTDDLPTPPDSSFAPSVQATPSVHKATPLPRPRKHPLPSGGRKEAALIFYLDRALDNVGKRATNRHVKELLPGELVGYKSFAELVKDLDPLVDVVWLDNAFAALFRGRDLDTNEPLPGFTNNRGISTTDKVRVKGVVERARSTVTKHLVGEEGEDAPEVDRKADNANKMDEGFVKIEGFDDSDDSDDEEEALERDERDVAHVFEKTVMELGDLLGGEMIGLVTDEEQDMRRQFEEDAAAMRERAELQDQGIMEFEDEAEAMAEQRQYIDDGKKEFQDEATWSGERHGFQAHGA